MKDMRTAASATEPGASSRPLFRPRPSHIHHLVTQRVLPYCPTTSSADPRSQRDAASQLSRSPPLALVAASPALRIFCEDEQPYRLGGAWWLNNYVCEEVLGHREGDNDGGRKGQQTHQIEKEEGGIIIIHPPGQSHDGAEGGGSRSTSNAKAAPADQLQGQKKGTTASPAARPDAVLRSSDGESISDDNDDSTDEDGAEDVLHRGSVVGVRGGGEGVIRGGLRSGVGVGGGGAGAGLAQDSQPVMTRASGHMALLPRQLSSTRLFAYLAGIPTTWISFCSTAAQSCCEDSLDALGVPTCLVEALRGTTRSTIPPPTTASASPARREGEVEAEEGGAATLALGDTAAMEELPYCASMTMVTSQLYVMCNHPEARFAHSVWWCRRRLAAARLYSRRRAALVREFALQRQVRFAQAIRRQPGRKEHFLCDVCDTQAVFLCADLSYFSTVEKVSLGRRGGPTSAADESLLSYVFLTGALALAVQKELHRERLHERVASARAKQVASGGREDTRLDIEPLSLPPVGHEEDGEAWRTGAAGVAPATRATAAEDREASHVDLVPLLDECEGSSQGSDTSEEEEEGEAHTRGADVRKRKAHPSLLFSYGGGRRWQRRREEEGKRARSTLSGREQGGAAAEAARAYQRLRTLVSQKLFRTTNALTTMHVHVEVSGGLVRECASALGRLAQAGGEMEAGVQDDLRSWDAAWLAELFPDVRLLDLDGEGSGTIVAGSYVGSAAGSRSLGGLRRGGAGGLVAAGGGRVTFQTTLTTARSSPSLSASTSPTADAADRASPSFSQAAAIAAATEARPPASPSFSPPPSALRTIRGLPAWRSLSRLFVRRCRLERLPAQLFASVHHGASEERTRCAAEDGGGEAQDRGRGRVYLSHSSSTASMPGDAAQHSSVRSSFEDLLAIPTRSSWCRGRGSFRSSTTDANAGAVTTQWPGAAATASRGLRELCVAACSGMPDDWLLPTAETEREHQSSSPLRAALRVLSITDMDMNAGRALACLHASLSDFPPLTFTAVTAGMTQLDLSRTATHSRSLKDANLPCTTPLLTVLRLSATDVRDVNCLAGLLHLRILNLAGSQADQEGLCLVPFFPQLRELYLMNCPNMVTAATPAQGGENPLPDAPSTRESPSLPVENVFSLGEWERAGCRLREVLGMPPDPIAAAASASVPLPPSRQQHARRRAAVPASTAWGVYQRRRTFPTLRVLDVSTNRLLTMHTLFPHLTVAVVPPASLDDATATLRARGSGHGVAKLLPPPTPRSGYFPRLSRLLLMLTAVSELGPLAAFCPRLTLLDASFTNVTTQGLWTQCELPDVLPLSLLSADPCRARRSKRGSDAFPPPLQLEVLRLSGTAVRSLAPLRLRPPADSLSALAEQQRNRCPSGASFCSSTACVSTAELLSHADFSREPLGNSLHPPSSFLSPFPVRAQTRRHRRDYDHDDDYYYSHQTQFTLAAETVHDDARNEEEEGAVAEPAREEGPRERRVGMACVRYGFADALALRELTFMNAPITGRGLGAAFTTARVVRHSESSADPERSLGAVSLAASVADGKLQALHLRGDENLLDREEWQARQQGPPPAPLAEEEEAGEERETGRASSLAHSQRMRRRWQHARPIATDGQLVSLALSNSGISAARQEDPHDVAVANRTLGVDGAGLLVALEANAPSLRLLDVAATNVSLNVFFRPADPRLRLTDVFIPLFIAEDHSRWRGDGGGHLQSSMWPSSERDLDADVDDEGDAEEERGYTSEEADEEVRDDVDAREHGNIALEEEFIEEEEEEAIFSDGLTRHRPYRCSCPEETDDADAETEEEARPGGADAGEAAALAGPQRQRKLHRFVARQLQDRRVFFWLRFLCQPDALVRPQVPQLRLDHLQVGGTAVGSFLDELVVHIREQRGEAIAAALQTAAALHELQHGEGDRGDGVGGVSARCGAVSASPLYTRVFSSPRPQMPPDVMEVVTHCRTVSAVVARALAMLWGSQCIVE